MEHKVIIDNEKCVGCGLCKTDCVGFDIDIVEGKAVARGNSCIKCGHCEAICPNKAITLTGYSDTVEEFEEQTRLNPNTLLNAIKTRRTIRQFTEEKVPKAVVDMIIEAGRLAPTGTNSQGTTFVILDSKKEECERVAVETFRKLLKAGKPISSKFSDMEIDDNFFFKKAPLVILILGKDTVSASLAAENMAFMAEANGLGVLFSGFFTGCYNLTGKLRNILGLPKKEKAVTTLVIGYPKVKYRRTVHRNDVKLIEA